jgi:hypothetical protein
MANPTAVFDLADLDGSNGFVIGGIYSYGRSGLSVSSAGDVNGDGFDDVIVGGYRVESDGEFGGSESYVVFGNNGDFVPNLDLAALDGTNGFVLGGVDESDSFGAAVSSAGDFNGDGIDDLIIGAAGADPDGRIFAGESYVVFGKVGGLADFLDLSALNGVDGFVIRGIDEEDGSGISVSSAGDVNGDGFDDVIIGTLEASVYDEDRAGQSYVVFGNDGAFPASLDLSTLDGSNGFVLNGIDKDDVSGVSVSSAGDLNGDGFDDLTIGAPGAGSLVENDYGQYSDRRGESYVVFGKAVGFTANLSLADLDGSNGFVLSGIDERDVSGYSVSSAGDVNGDGFDDLIIGADGADLNGNYGAGESYVVFGKAEAFSAVVDLGSLDGMNGFTINGIDEGDFSGYSVSSAGDVNGDGFNDLIIGTFRVGESYVVFGKAEAFSAVVDLGSLDGMNGFTINGIDEGDYSGYSVSSAGDVNGDGYDDLVIGALGADPNGRYDAGESYVIFGGPQFGAAGDVERIGGPGDDSFVGGDGDDTLTGKGGDDTLVGKQGDDRLSGGRQHDLLKGGGGDDTLMGEQGHDTLHGGHGDDSLDGGALGDKLRGGDGDDTLDGGDGWDRLQGGDGDDLLMGGAGFDYLFGQDGDDTLNGGSYSDVLKGGDGNDSLDGDAGNDRLDGGGGDDTLTGDSGADVFNFAFAGRGGADVITDFERSADTIRIGGYGDDLDDFSDLVINEENGHTLIDLTASLANGTDAGTILVEGVTGLDADNFAFG